jgi:hypothetical protein
MPWIDVEVTAISPVAVERDVSVDVPDGMHVVAMEIESGGVRAQAHAMPATDASERFLRIVRLQRDPALLEQGDDGRVVLHVYPVERDRPAHARILLARETQVLGEQTALYAETPPPAHERIPVVIIDQAPSVERETSLDPREIRRFVHLHQPQLRRCYDVALLRDHALAGTAELHFVIGADGAVATAAVDGSLPSADALACLEHEVATWQFHATDGPIAVNYPIDFEPPR